MSDIDGLVHHRIYMERLNEFGDLLQEVRKELDRLILQLGQSKEGLYTGAPCTDGNHSFLPLSADLLMYGRLYCSRCGGITYGKPL